MYVLAVADGWTRILDLFESVHIAEMDRHPCRFMVLLIDCDGKANRLEKAKSVIPDHLIDRVFVLGALDRSGGPQGRSRLLRDYR